MTSAASLIEIMRSRPVSFFLAGVMQGARQGRELADQSYRATLKVMISSRMAHAQIHDPAQHMWENLRNPREQIRAAHAALQYTTTVTRSAMAPALVELTEIFHRQTAHAGRCDVCVVYLPNNEPSMGTAAEMLTAYQANKFVVTITGMRQNLALLACSHLIVDSLAEFDLWLSTWCHSAQLVDGTNP